ncbi:hypothetical protein E8D34_14235 [Nocardioides sp. GY 10113]|nr:hypothetical protein E8D34_14235 [Nocardioides sp. GY 10113]
MHDADDWVVLGIEAVAARPPHRPWQPDDLAAASATVTAMADLLTPAPVGLTSAVEEFAPWLEGWRGIEHPQAAEFRDLAGRYAHVVAGDTLVHTDIRDDNLLFLGDGTVLLCDWNWPVAGAAWLDSLLLLLGPRGDGLDVEAHIRNHPLLSAVDPEEIDIVLALVLGYFVASAAQPVPSFSPYLREAQAWQRDVLHDWLTERRDRT